LTHYYKSILTNMATLDQLNAALIKADAAGNVDDARAFASEIRRMRAEATPAPVDITLKPTEVIAKPEAPATLTEKLVGSTTGRVGLGIASPIVGLARLGENALVSAGGPSLGIGATWDELQAMKQKGMNALAPPEKFRNPYLQDVDVAGGVASMALPAKILSGVAPAVTFGKQVLQNTGIGAALGLTNPNAQDLSANAESAAWGALLGPTVAPATIAAAKSLGWVYDAVKGKLVQMRAGNIIREIAGADKNALIAAGNVAAPELTGAQAAAGIQNAQMQALGELAKGQNTGSFFSKKTLLAKQDAQAVLDTLAGGTTQAEANLARKGANVVLNQKTTPLRETELAAANTAGALTPALQAEATRFGEAAAGKVEDVRRMTAAGERAKVLSKSWVSSSGGAEGVVRRPIQYTYPGELVKKAEKVATTAAEESLILGENARFVQSKIDSLAANGLTPIDTSAIKANIQSKLADPKVGVSDVNKRVLNAVGKKIEEWTANNGGVIDAQALYEIRKNTVGETVQKLMGGADPKASAKVAAKILSQVNPMIDEAIVKAGGTGWANYLSTHSAGLRDIERQKMAGVLSDLYRKGSMDKFQSIVNGNDVKAIEAIFGKGNVDIKALMGDKHVPLQKIADDIVRTESMLTQAKQGTTGLTDILTKDATKMRLPALFSRVATVSNKALDILEAKVNRATFAALEKGMQSGKSMAELISALPTSERNAVIKTLSDPKVAQQLTAISVSTGTNALTNNTNQNALANQ
jgi:hypothetical protein